MSGMNGTAGLWVDIVVIFIYFIFVVLVFRASSTGHRGLIGFDSCYEEFDLVATASLCYLFVAVWWTMAGRYPWG